MIIISKFLNNTSMSVKIITRIKQNITTIIQELLPVALEKTRINDTTANPGNNYSNEKWSMNTILYNPYMYKIFTAQTDTLKAVREKARTT